MGIHVLNDPQIENLTTSTTTRRGYKRRIKTTEKQLQISTLPGQSSSLSCTNLEIKENDLITSICQHICLFVSTRYCLMQYSYQLYKDVSFNAIISFFIRLLTIK